MQQKTNILLYEYWNRVRNGRIAPHRYEILPAQIASLLPETFIAECAGMSNFQIRLAGTRICDNFGRELRGQSLLDFWQGDAADTLGSLLNVVVSDGAAGVADFTAAREDGRSAAFEMVLMPLIHTGRTVNRLLGGLTAVDPPFWLGTSELQTFELTRTDLIWPDGHVAPLTNQAGRWVGEGPRRFRVLEGGLAGEPR